MITRRSRPPARPRRDARKIVKLAAIGVAVAAIMFFGSYLVAVRILFPPLPEPEDGIVVPSLIGMTVPQAEARMRQIGLRVTESTQIAHPTQPPGIVIAQSPLPGQQLRSLGAVRLGVSSGLPRIPVPNVIGFSAERARAAMAAVGFQTEEMTIEDEMPAGTVVRVSPPVGSSEPVPSRVLLYVSTGPPQVAPDTLAAPPDTVPLSRTNE